MLSKNTCFMAFSLLQVISQLYFFKKLAISENIVFSKIFHVSRTSLKSNSCVCCRMSPNILIKMQDASPYIFKIYFTKTLA